MNYEIIIEKPYLKSKNNKIFLNSDIMINNKKETAFIAVNKEYKDFFVTENIDAFIIALLPFAFKNNCTITSESKVSKKLLYQITQYLNPCLETSHLHLNMINFNTENLEDEEIKSKNKVATIYSGKNEIDSLFTIFENQNEELNEFKITHLLKIKNSYPENLILPKGEIDKICNELKISMIDVETNILEILKENYNSVGVYINISIIYALHKLFNTLLNPALQPFANFKYGENSSEYELLIANSLKLPNLNICAYGGAYTQNRKNEILKENKFAQKYIK